MVFVIFRVNVFQKLVAESQVHRFFRHAKLISVIDHQFEVLRDVFLVPALIGDIDGDHLVHLVADFVGKSAIPGSDLPERVYVLEEGAQELHTGLDRRGAGLRSFTSGHPWMIPHPLEQLIL
jgi:hypothetical protein